MPMRYSSIGREEVDIITFGMERDAKPDIEADVRRATLDSLWKVQAR